MVSRALRNRHAFWVLWIALALAGAVLAVFAFSHLYFALDLRIAQAWQRLDPEPMEPVFWSLNTLNGEMRAAVALAVVGGGLLAMRPRVPLFLVAAMSAQGANPILKELIARPRPSALLVDVSEKTAGLSFSSGHTMNAVIFFGFLFFVIDDVIASPRLRLAARTACALIIVLTGPARVLSSAHWPSDVLGGYLFGALVLLPLVWMYRTVRSRQVAQQPFRSNIH